MLAYEVLDGIRKALIQAQRPGHTTFVIRGQRRSIEQGSRLGISLPGTTSLS